MHTRFINYLFVTINDIGVIISVHKRFMPLLTLVRSRGGCGWGSLS